MDAASKSLLQHLRTLLEESDRGCVLIETSRLDELLKELHRDHIESATSAPKKFLDALFATHAPLSTFAARIQLGYGYGLISRDDYLDLELLRKLRNDVAHSTVDFSFRSSEARQRVFALKAPKRIQHTLPGIPFTLAELEAAKTPTDDDKTAKLYLLMSGMSLSVAIFARQTLILRYERKKLDANRGMG